MDGKLPTSTELARLMAGAQGGLDRKDRSDAVIRMGESGDPRLVLTPIACCNDRDADIRRYATEAFSKLRSGRSVESLIERLLDANEQPATRRAAAAALVRIRTYRAVEGLSCCLATRVVDGDLQTAVSDMMEETGIR